METLAQKTHSVFVLVAFHDLLQFFGDELEALVDGVGSAGDGDDPLGAGAVRDVDLGAALGQRRQSEHSSAPASNRHSDWTLPDGTLTRPDRG